MISICREHAKNVKHWQDGPMAMQWCAAGMIEATRQFRQVNGHLHVPALRAALERHVAEQSAGADRQDENANPA
jgi:putative transposase